MNLDKETALLAETVINREVLDAAIKRAGLIKLADNPWLAPLIGSGIGAAGGALSGYLASDEDPKKKMWKRMLLHSMLGAGIGGTVGYGLNKLPGTSNQDLKKTTTDIAQAGKDVVKDKPEGFFGPKGIDLNWGRLTGGGLLAASAPWKPESKIWEGVRKVGLKGTQAKIMQREVVKRLMNLNDPAVLAAAEAEAARGAIPGAKITKQIPRTAAQLSSGIESIGRRAMSDYPVNFIGPQPPGATHKPPINKGLLNLPSSWSGSGVRKALENELAIGPERLNTIAKKLELEHMPVSRLRRSVGGTGAAALVAPELSSWLGSKTYDWHPLKRLARILLSPTVEGMGQDPKDWKK